MCCSWQSVRSKTSTVNVPASQPTTADDKSEGAYFVEIGAGSTLNEHEIDRSSVFYLEKDVFVLPLMRFLVFTVFCIVCTLFPYCFFYVYLFFFVFFNVLLTLRLITISVNNQLDAQFFFLVFLYSSSLHVSSNQVLIIRRVNCINTTSGICHYLQVAVWCVGLDGNLRIPEVVLIQLTLLMMNTWVLERCREME